jgi:FkbM family methyltransferase
MPAPEPDLVYDVGMHVGEDTAYYLERGYRVVAVEANPRLIEDARARFAQAIEEGGLDLVHAVVAERAATALTFHLSRRTIWSSLDRELAERDGLYDGAVEVPSVTLAQLMSERGAPLYCKIDIEGADLAALRSLDGAPYLPRFISVESGGPDSAGLATLDALRELGYGRFKLVDQNTLLVLDSRRRFYSRPRVFLDRVGELVGRPRATWPRRALYHRLHHHFPEGSSGPFGEDLAGRWLDHQEARELLLFHSQDYLHHQERARLGFWCDWHAELG